MPPGDDNAGSVVVTLQGELGFRVGTEEPLVGVDGCCGKRFVGDPLCGRAGKRWSEEAFRGKYLGEPVIALLRLDTSASAITAFMSTL